MLKLLKKNLKSLTKLWLIALRDFVCISPFHPPIQQLFDQRWHKIMLGVTDSRAKLWVDCQPVKSIQGNIEYPLRERGQYDTHDGYLSIAQIANTRSYQVRIARQFMMTLLLNRWLIFPLFVSFLCFHFSQHLLWVYTIRTTDESKVFCYRGGAKSICTCPPPQLTVPPAWCNFLSSRCFY